MMHFCIYCAFKGLDVSYFELSKTFLDRPQEPLKLPWISKYSSETCPYHTNLGPRNSLANGESWVVRW